MCAARGLVVPATDVDHIKDSRADYSDDNSRSNLQSLCHSCHSVKTAQDMGKSTTMGCDVNGIPTDARHHWNIPKRSPAVGGALIAPDLLFNR